MRTLIQDLSFAARSFAKSPGFTAVVVISIALGIAANSTVYSVVNSLVYGSIPVKDPSRLLTMNDGRSVSWPNYTDVRDQATGKVFSGVAAFFPLAPRQHRRQRPAGTRLGSTHHGQLLRRSRCKARARPGLPSRRGQGGRPRRGGGARPCPVAAALRCGSLRRGPSHSSEWTPVYGGWRRTCGIHRDHQDFDRRVLGAGVNGGAPGARPSARRSQGQSQRAVADRGRAIEGWRVPGTGAGSPGRHQEPDRLDLLQGRETASSRLDTESRGPYAGPRQHGRVDGGVDGGGGTGVADRLCQCRQPDAGTRRLAQQGDRDSSFNRRQPLAFDPATADRECVPGARRRFTRLRDGFIRGGGAVPVPAADGAPAGLQLRAGLARGALHDRNLGGDGSPVWTGAGDSFDTRRPGDFAQR